MTWVMANMKEVRYVMKCPVWKMDKCYAGLMGIMGNAAHPAATRATHFTKSFPDDLRLTYAYLPVG